MLLNHEDNHQIVVLDFGKLLTLDRAVSASLMSCLERDEGVCESGSWSIDILDNAGQYHFPLVQGLNQIDQHGTLHRWKKAAANQKSKIRGIGSSMEDCLKEASLQVQSPQPKSAGNHAGQPMG
jgi:hypothetical protein